MEEKPTLNIVLTDIREYALNSAGFYSTEADDDVIMNNTQFKKYVQDKSGATDFGIISLKGGYRVASEIKGRPGFWNTTNLGSDYLVDLLTSFAEPDSVPEATQIQNTNLKKGTNTPDYVSLEDLAKNVNTVVIHGVTREELDKEMPYLNQQFDIKYL